MPLSPQGGSDPDNLEYAGALVQRSLLEVARAADDLQRVMEQAAQAGRERANTLAKLDK